MGNKRVLAWHFLYEGNKMRDGKEAKEGETYTLTDGPIEICSRGFHGSKNLMDALYYAPGPVLSRVRIWGDIEEESDKLVGRSREVLWILDATNLLHEFACLCAEKALKGIKNPDIRSLNAIEIKLKWLRGEATDEELYAAESAARSAAWSAARSAARAARSAAESAAWSAAWSAARSAAWSAARSAAWLAERKWQEKTLLKLIKKYRGSLR